MQRIRINSPKIKTIKKYILDVEETSRCSIRLCFILKHGIIKHTRAFCRQNQEVCAHKKQFQASCGRVIKHARHNGSQQAWIHCFVLTLSLCHVMWPATHWKENALVVFIPSIVSQLPLSQNLRHPDSVYVAWISPVCWTQPLFLSSHHH